MTSATPPVSQNSKKHLAKDAAARSSTAKKVKMTKDERRTKYTDIARKRRQKQQQHSTPMRGGRGGGDGGKKNVCYHCRQPGHIASSCPETRTNTTDGAPKSLVDEGPESGVLCYKCGSTEHALHQCPQKNRGDRKDLPYAKCFVCSNKGHLASSCPQNSKGIYVNGGCCRMCGSQQHLATECPEKRRKKQGTSVEDKDANAEDSNFDDLLATEPDDLLATELKSSSSRDKLAVVQPIKKKRVVTF